MKFSYPLIKKFIPGLKDKDELKEALLMHSFEVEDTVGDVLEIKLPPNRYSDAASHWGIAKEAAAILDLEIFDPEFFTFGGNLTDFKIAIEDKILCPRYTAAYFEGLEIKPSPEWLQKTLKDCGLRPINNVVDIMNYIMLEIGQPLHAFDFDKLEKELIIRKAKKGEEVISIDGGKFILNGETLVIADAKKILAIAGIKGGQGSEVTESTKKILVESANFDSASIYKTSKILDLVTDASMRFSRGISPTLALLGQQRAAILLGDIADAKSSKFFDSIEKPFPRTILKFDIEKFNKFIGINFSQKEAEKYLIRLGFKDLGKNQWEVPVFRSDIENHEDLAEEVIRLYGFDKLQSKPPFVAIKPTEFDDLIVLKDKAKLVLTGFGIDEVYNPSFLGEASKDNNLFQEEIKNHASIELANPISEDKKYLRESLTPALLKNIDDNFRFFEKVSVFEFGKVFSSDAGKLYEKNALGVVLAQKNKSIFFELKGIISQFLKNLGLSDFIIKPSDPKRDNFEGLIIESENKNIGYLVQKNDKSVAEIDFDKLLVWVEGELSFKPIPKYPAIMRDLSFYVQASEKIGDIVEFVEQGNQWILDVDLIDEYFDKKLNSQSITLRVIFQAEDKTLTAEEVDKEMKKIISNLGKKFKIEFR